MAWKTGCKYTGFDLQVTTSRICSEFDSYTQWILRQTWLSSWDVDLASISAWFLHDFRFPELVVSYT